MKALLKIVGVLLLLVIIGVVVLVLNLDKGIKAAVETLGPKFTQSEVQLDKVSLSARSGEGSLRGLVVGNPSGFQSANAFSLGEIAIALDTETVASEVIIINSIRILQPEITYEMGKPMSNLQQLQKNVQQAVGTSSSSAESESAESSRKMIIRDLVFAGGKIHYSNPLLSDRTVELALPEIHLSGIGEKSGGATAVEVVDQVISVVNKQVSNAVINSDAVKDLGKQVTDRVEQEKGKIEEKKQELEGSLQNLKGVFDRDK